MLRYKVFNSIKIAFLIVVLALLVCGCGSSSTKEDSLWKPSAYVQVDGTILRSPEGEVLMLKGIAFGNHVWENPESSSSFTHHSPEDFDRVKDLGFNSIRFYINYGLFEDDSKPYVYKQAGFDWLDRNIADAKKSGIYLILNMHYPQGGFQSNGEGDALWNSRSNQDRLVALWREIARRYKDEKIIIGYGLVNEPVPVNGVAQWADLAQKIIDAIRSEDAHHLLFVERAIWVKSGYTEEDGANLYFPKGLKDPGPGANIVYEFHMYDPMLFTHQNASWLSSYVGKYSTYPDAKRIEVAGEQWEIASETGEKAPAGNFGWTAFGSQPFTVANENYKLAKPVLQAHSIGSGAKIRVDDIVLEEIDPSGVSVRTVSIAVDGDEEWYYWSDNESGSAAVITDALASGGRCIEIGGSSGDANVTFNSSKLLVKRNYKYRISGKLKGEGIAASAIVRFRVDLYSCESVHAWDRAYLQSIVDKYIDYSKENNVPVYLGEFGAIVFAYQSNRGGALWLGDMLDILNRGNVNYNYHTYHESNFGLYLNPDSELPDVNMRNEEAAELFMRVQNR